MSSSNQVAGKRLLSFIERIERLEEEAKAINADKSEVYKVAKSTGFDVKAMKRCVQLRRMDTADRVDFEDMVAVYMDALEEFGTPIATRAGARDDTPHDPETGEITETESAVAGAPADVAPDLAAGAPSNGVHPPREEAKVRDSLSEEYQECGHETDDPAAHEGLAVPSEGEKPRTPEPLHQSMTPNEIIPDDMPPGCNRRIEAAE